MRVFHGFGDLPRFQSPVVTVGSFDGLHQGHRKLLGIVGDIARRNGGESVVVTFSPHPRQVLAGGGDVRLLTTLGEKIYLMERAGVDNLIVAPFTREFSMLSYHDFVKDFLVARVGVRTLVVGYNHHLGHDKGGDFASLEAMGRRFGFSIYMVPRHDVDHDKVSSTVVRRLVADGRMAEAGKYLGGEYLLSGREDADGCFVPDEPAKLLPPPGEYRVRPVGTDLAPRTLEIYPDGRLKLIPAAADTETMLCFV